MVTGALNLLIGVRSLVKHRYPHFFTPKKSLERLLVHIATIRENGQVPLLFSKIIMIYLEFFKASKCWFTNSLSELIVYILDKYSISTYCGTDCKSANLCSIKTNDIIPTSLGKIEFCGILQDVSFKGYGILPGKKDGCGTYYFPDDSEIKCNYSLLPDKKLSVLDGKFTFTDKRKNIKFIASYDKGNLVTGEYIEEMFTFKWECKNGIKIEIEEEFLVELIKLSLLNNDPISYKNLWDNKKYSIYFRYTYRLYHNYWGKISDEIIKFITSFGGLYKEAIFPNKFRMSDYNNSKLQAYDMKSTPISSDAEVIMIKVPLNSAIVLGVEYEIIPVDYFINVFWYNMKTLLAGRNQPEAGIYKKSPLTSSSIENADIVKPSPDLISTINESDNYNTEQNVEALKTKLGTKFPIYIHDQISSMVLM